jgi:hypothetical protein
MSSQRIQSEFVYKSVTSAAETYYFTIRCDTESNLSVRNIQNPAGLIVDSMSSLPSEVITDISDAMSVVRDLLSINSRVNGTITFTAETSVTVSLPEAMSTAGYSVLLDVSDFVLFRVTSKTTTSFVVQSSTTYTGTILYSVFN